MKRLKKIFVLILMLILTACAKSPWQEQYELGLKYLAEGNYEEAILSFTAAIEIDPKQPLAYIGRGDAYFAYDDMEDHFDFAITDFYAVLDIDEMYVDAYLRLADVYFKLDDAKVALDILHEGYSVTNDKRLKERMEQEGFYYYEDISAYLIVNEKEYQAELESMHNEADSDTVGWRAGGIRYNKPIQANIVEKIDIKESEVSFTEGSGLSWDLLQLLDEYDESNWEDSYNWDYFEKNMLVSGYLSYDTEYQRNSFDEEGPFLRPNGPYKFTIVEYKFE